MSTGNNHSRDGDSLRRCHYAKCGHAKGNGDSRLQRCSGCLSTYYCSKTCQRNDWKLHKSVCRASGSVPANAMFEDQLQKLGFENQSAFSEALTQWLDAHKWALQTCIDVAVIRGCGINSIQTPQRMVRLSLACRTSLNLPSTRNPSSLFQLREQSFMTLEEYLEQQPDLRQDWERGAPIRASLCDQLKTQPLFVGLVPALLCLDGLDMTSFVYYPQYRTDPQLLSTATLLAPVRHVVLADILKLAIASINGNFPLRTIASDPRVQAIPGRFVRNHGTWTWQQLCPDWTQYRRGQHRGIDETLTRLQSGIAPTELMFALRALAV